MAGRFVLLLALLIPLAASGGSDPKLEKRFFDSDYTVCDAHFVSKTFGFSLQDSKSYIGQKIEWGTTDILDSTLAETRMRGKKDRTVRCQFYQTGYAMEDAEALAQYWGIGVSDAKVRVEDKILDGNEAYLASSVLPDARQLYYAALGGPSEAVVDSGQLAAFLSQSKYDACHAKMLVGTYFGSSLTEAKAWIGFKIQNRWTDTVDLELAAVRARHQKMGTQPCAFADTPWTSKDAAVLAKLWGQSLQDAKARIENKYVYGSESIIAEELQRAGAR